MKISDARRRVILLREEIERHNDLYYRKNSPAISDFEYDLLIHELETIEKKFPELQSPDSPTQNVGNDILKEFVQVPHQYPMLSLANTYSIEELYEFDKRVRKVIEGNPIYVCELKLDGASISLSYMNGRFVRATTRGDGEKGDDVSANVLTIKSVPLELKGARIPAELTMRGEIIIHREDFIKMNKLRVDNDEQPFANPRNAASGTLKLLNSLTVANRPLDCYLYYLLGKELPSDSHFDNMKYASSWGFKVSDAIKKCSDINEVFKFINYWESRRKEIDFEIDGVVVKVDSIASQMKLGYTSKTPRWAVAYKYKAEQERTKLLSVSFQVGRTGAVTPVANLEPVLLAGTTVKRASLHNADQIQIIDLHYEDMVYIEKGGEIIPKIVGVDISSRKTKAGPVDFPSVCPECGTTLTRQEGEAGWFCPNEKACPPQLKGRVEHFISRKAMNIDGLGEETVDLLFSSNLIKNAADLYDLKTEDLALLEGLGHKSATNIIRSIQNSMSTPFHKLVYALGIRHVGEATARTLAVSFRDILRLMEATVEDLVGIQDIGPKIAKSVTAFFNDSDNIEIVKRLENYGLTTRMSGDPGENVGSVLSGKSIVITGVFSRHSREEYKEIIGRLGGKVKSSVTAGTDFILAGSSPGKSKIETAGKLNIELLSEEDFLSIIDEL